MKKVGEMIMNYCTKYELYQTVAHIKASLGLDTDKYNIDLIPLLKNTGIKVEILPFQTVGLRGMAIPDNVHDIILLSSKRNLIEQNFDAAHEVMHLEMHRHCCSKAFHCFEKIKPNQNSYIEWQANEGAAEFFVPYLVLLPIIKSEYHLLNNLSCIEAFKKELVSLFKVPEAVIKYRLDNLKYEIQQYVSGIPLDEIEVLSLAKQKERNIFCKSLNEISNENFNRKLYAWISYKNLSQNIENQYNIF